MNSCWQDLDEADDDTSLVTGDCEFADIQINMDQDPITISAGEDGMLGVQVAVSGNCEDYLDRIEIEDDGPADPDIFVYGCSGDDCANNMGTCEISISVPSNAEPGTYTGTIRVEAFGGENNNVTISGSQTFQIIVVSVEDFSIDVPPSFGVAQNSNISVNIEISRTGGHSADIEFSIEPYPAYVNYSFSPNPAGSTVDNVTFDVAALSNAVVGDYSLEVIASAGGIEKHDIFTLHVIPPFYLTISPEAIEIQQGQSATMEVYMNRMGGYSNTILLSAQGDIVGTGNELVAITFDPNSVQGMSSTASLTVGNLVEPGTYAVTFKGSVGPVNKYITFDLTVFE